MKGTCASLIRLIGMAYEYLTEIAQRWVAEQGEDAAPHLAEAARALRRVGDAKGARLLMQIAARMDEMDVAPSPPRRRRTAIRRARTDDFDPSA
jgi:hypothetical protein